MSFDNYIRLISKLGIWSNFYFDLKNLPSKIIFDSKRNLGFKKMLIPKHFWSQNVFGLKNFWSVKFMRPKISLVQEIFLGPNLFLSKNSFSQNFLKKIIFGPKNFEVTINFWCKKNEVANNSSLLNHEQAICNSSTSHKQVKRNHEQVMDKFRDY